MAKLPPKSHSKMSKEDKLVAGLIVIKKIPYGFDVHDRVRSVMVALEQAGYTTEVRRSGYVVELLGKTYWRIETKSEHFLLEFKRQVAESPGPKMPYEIEIIPSHKEACQRLNARDWASDYSRTVGRNMENTSPIIDFALVHADRLHRWSAIDGIVGWALRKFGRQKRCQFCGEILTFPYMNCEIQNTCTKNRKCNTHLLVCSKLSFCESRERGSRRDWEAHRAEGVRL